MATKTLGGVLEHLRRAVLRQAGAGLTDGELLEGYVTRRDDGAFEALVRRHGPMVLGVCRRVLRNEADAEDAFQATFLVLVRKAASVRPRGMVGNWLHGVAHNTARKAKAMNSRRRVKERAAEQPSGTAATAEQRQHLEEVLDEALGGLPDRYRVAIVLCDLEGETIKEAARRVGCPAGTLGARLSRGRALLARRLARQGLNLSGGLLAATLAPSVASAAVPAPLVAATVKAAGLFAAGRATSGVITERVAALTEGVLKAMLLTKLKIAGLLLAVGLALTLGVASQAREESAASAPTTAAAPPDQFTPLDLKPYANQKLTEQFGTLEGNNLKDLGKGGRTFGGVNLKLGEGVIQLTSKLLQVERPAKVEGIKVGGKECVKVHILHATGYGNGPPGSSIHIPDDTQIAEYKVRYEDGKTESIPVVYGQDVRDWWFDEGESKGVTRGKVVWTGDNEAAKGLERRLRLYLTTWVNPHPGKKIASIDYLRTGDSVAAPFCVAITLEAKAAAK
jgi:RNA polymerase sigma factor (sigma-70 family)